MGPAVMEEVSVEVTMAFLPGDKTINANGHFIRGKEKSTD